MQHYVTPVQLALLLAGHLACVAATAAIVVSPRLGYPGWRVLGPGGLHWFCFLGAWTFAALISWVWLFVGSARADGEAQMRIALLLAAGFCAGAAVAGFQIARLKRAALRWRGSAVRWREGAREHVQDFSQFDAIRRRFDGAMLIRFKDQTVLVLDICAEPASDFLARLAEEAGEEVC